MYSDKSIPEEGKSKAHKLRDQLVIAIDSAKLAGLNGMASKLLFVYFRYADFNTRQCWPGLATLSRVLGTDQSNILRARRELEERGLIRIVQKGKGGRGHSTRVEVFPDADAPDTRTNPEHVSVLGKTENTSARTSVSAKEETLVSDGETLVSDGETLVSERETLVPAQDEQIQRTNKNDTRTNTCVVGYSSCCDDVKKDVKSDGSHFRSRTETKATSSKATSSNENDSDEATQRLLKEFVEYEAPTAAAARRLITDRGLVAAAKILRFVKWRDLIADVEGKDSKGPGLIVWLSGDKNRRVNYPKGFLKYDRHQGHLDPAWREQNTDSLTGEERREHPELARYFDEVLPQAKAIAAKGALKEQPNVTPAKVTADPHADDGVNQGGEELDWHAAWEERVKAEESWAFARDMEIER